MERQRWKSHQCPSCTIYKMLGQWQLSREMVQWPADMGWLANCTCDVDVALEQNGLSQQEWSHAFRGIAFADFYHLVFSALPTFVDGTGVERKVSLKMMACHKNGPRKPKGRPVSGAAGLAGLLSPTGPGSALPSDRVSLATAPIGIQRKRRLPTVAAQAARSHKASSMGSSKCGEDVTFTLYTELPQAGEKAVNRKSGERQSRVFEHCSMDTMPGYISCLGVDSSIRKPKNKHAWEGQVQGVDKGDTTSGGSKLSKTKNRKKNDYRGPSRAVKAIAGIVSKSYLSPKSLLAPPALSPPTYDGSPTGRLLSTNIRVELCRRSSANESSPGLGLAGSTSERATIATPQSKRLKPLQGAEIQSFLRPTSAKVRMAPRGYGDW